MLIVVFLIIKIVFLRPIGSTLDSLTFLYLIFPQYSFNIYKLPTRKN